MIKCCNKNSLPVSRFCFTFLKKTISRLACLCLSLLAPRPPQPITSLSCCCQCTSGVCPWRCVSMGSVQSCVAASLSACSLCILYVHVYRPHQLLKSNVLRGSSLPAAAYLYFRCARRAAGRRAGCLYPPHGADDVTYTITDCR